MRISDLYRSGKAPFREQDLYIVGTGPSMTVFPREWLRGKCCVLLNDAQKHMPELGPIAFSNNLKFLTGCNLPYQIVKGRLRFDPNPERDDNHCRWDDPGYYVFSYRERPWDGVSHHDPGQLWKEPNHYWNMPRGSVSIFAAQFCLLAGARSITLVGCDSCELGPGAEYLASKKRTAVRHDYDAYAAGLMRIKQEALRRFRVPMFTLSPFMGLGREVEQFREIRQW